MKKVAVFITTALLVTSSQSAVFGAQVPTDVVGTPYESAVTVLVEKGIITGNSDGTFRPASPINRAEASVITAKAAEVTQAELASAPDRGFRDLNGFAWAEGYINYCASIGAVSGYPGDQFRPGSHVTYAETAAMLVSAMGYTADDLEGSWPDNYLNKALELGMLEHLILSGTLDPDAAATRGNVAIMAQVCEADIAIQAKANALETDSAYMRLQNNLLQAAVELSQLDLDTAGEADAAAAADKLADAANSLLNATPPAKYQSEHSQYVQAAAVYVQAAECLKDMYAALASGDEPTAQLAYDAYATHLKNAVSIINTGI